MILELKELLNSKGETIRLRWYKLIADTYPPVTSKFLQSKKDLFDNPVGHAISTMVDSVMECIIGGADPAGLRACLLPLIRIRAVQDFSPSHAVSFVHLLKKASREALLEDELLDTSNMEALQRLNAVIDEMVLISFDGYSECREKLHEVKEEEMKRSLYLLLKKANMLDLQEVKRG